MIAASTIEHTYLVAIFLPFDMVVNSYREEQILWFLLQSERSKRGDELLVVRLIDELDGKRMAGTSYSFSVSKKLPIVRCVSPSFWMNS